MGIVNYFKRVDSLSAEQTREFLSDKTPGDYNLIDVRQPGEYEKGHIPGAYLIPVGELRDRIEEIDRNKPTITYCGSGFRSRAAAAVLEGEGFSKIYNMDGGIRAWNGLIAEGVPNSGMAYFGSATGSDELIGLAWKLEHGSRKFYTFLGDLINDDDARHLFRKLERAEEHHASALIQLFTEVTGSEPDDLFPKSVLSADIPEDIMEGGILLDEARHWAQGKDVREILEFSMSLETNAYDLYIKMARTRDNAQSQRIFNMLARDEQKHLAQLAALLEEKL